MQISLHHRLPSFSSCLCRRLSHHRTIKLELLIAVMPEGVSRCRALYDKYTSPLLLRGAPDYSTDTVSEFHAEAQRQLQVKAQGPYVAARAGVEPTTLL